MARVRTVNKPIASILLGAALAACSTPPATPEDQSKAGPQLAQAATTPLGDLNLVRAEIPAVLVAAHKAPYAMPADAGCTMPRSAPTSTRLPRRRTRAWSSAAAALPPMSCAVQPKAWCRSAAGSASSAVPSATPRLSLRPSRPAASGGASSKVWGRPPAAPRPPHRVPSARGAGERRARRVAQCSRSFTRKRAMLWLCNWQTRDSVTPSTAAISFRFMSCS
jgi:hypothetical protein